MRWVISWARSRIAWASRGASVPARRVWRLRCAPGRLTALCVSCRQDYRAWRRVCSSGVLHPYGSFRSVATYQYIPTAKHGQAMLAAKQPTRGR